MSKIKLLLTAVVCLFLVNSVFAQNEKRDEFQPSYEVKLQILSASNKAGGKIEVPDALSTIVRKLREHQSFNNYELVETYTERIAEGGSIEFRGISNRLNAGTEKQLAIFTDWTIRSLQNVKNSTGKNFLQFNSFRYGARVPVLVGDVANYEQIGITINKLSLPENVPTLAGSLSMPQADGFVFVILTVKKAAE